MFEYGGTFSYFVIYFSECLDFLVRFIPDYDRLLQMEGKSASNKKKTAKAENLQFRRCLRCGKSSERLHVRYINLLL